MAFLQCSKSTDRVSLPMPEKGAYLKGIYGNNIARWLFQKGVSEEESENQREEEHMT